jgi:hypothetical protein
VQEARQSAARDVLNSLDRVEAPFLLSIFFADFSEARRSEFMTLPRLSGDAVPL